MAKDYNRQVALKWFGETANPAKRTCVSTVEIERTFTYGFAQPTTFIEFQTVIFWDGTDLHAKERTVYTEEAALEAHEEFVALVEERLLELVSVF
jgi:hypothetical protein